VSPPPPVAASGSGGGSAGGGAVGAAPTLSLNSSMARASFTLTISSSLGACTSRMSTSIDRLDEVGGQLAGPGPARHGVVVGLGLLVDREDGMMPFCGPPCEP